MANDAHLDQRYFIDDSVYNCPFCNRRHVRFIGPQHYAFDWSGTQRCYVYFVQCLSCTKTSMHLSKSSLSDSSAGRFVFNDEIEDLDSKFFYQVPTSFFVIDSRVPRELRDLLTEAEGCLKGNFLTGASACARKLIYTLAVKAGAVGEHYEDKVKALKTIYFSVDPTYFDTLLAIQKVTSSKVHENALDGWEAKHLKVMLAAIKEALHEIFVVPALRAEAAQKIKDLGFALTPNDSEKP
jgi:hypothetical protein